MDIESINKYLNKKIILILKNGFNYRGKIIKIYNSSFDFIDIIGNELTIDISNISLMQVERINEGKLKNEEAPSNNYQNNAASEKQISLLKRLKYSGDIKNLTKIEAKKIIEEYINKNKKNEESQDY